MLSFRKATGMTIQHSAYIPLAAFGISQYKLQETLKNSVFIWDSHLSSQHLIGHLLWEKEIMNIEECGRLCNYSHKCSVPHLPLIYLIWPHDFLQARKHKPELYESTSSLPYPLPSAMGLAVFSCPGGEKTWSRAAAGL